MLHLEWTTPAADELDAAQEYYHSLNPTAATMLARRIVEAAGRLCRTPGIGRPGLAAGTREWVVQRTPYVLIYRDRSFANDRRRDRPGVRMNDQDPLQCTYADARRATLLQGIDLDTRAKVAFFEEMVSFAVAFGARDRLPDRHTPEPRAS